MMAVLQSVVVEGMTPLVLAWVVHLGVVLSVVAQVLFLQSRWGQGYGRLQKVIAVVIEPVNAFQSLFN
jgi:hypothetical protein